MEAITMNGCRFRKEGRRLRIMQTAADCGKVLMPVLAAMLLSACVDDDVDVGAQSLAVNSDEPPVLKVVMPVNYNTILREPEFTFDTDKPGVIIHEGPCTSSNINADKGHNTLVFTGLEPGSYSDCSIMVKDDWGNVSEPLLIPEFHVIRTRLINDTGIVWCGNYAYGYNGTHDNNLDCSAVGAGVAIDGIDSNGSPVPAGQDALFGRDADPGRNDDSDGHAGFSFTKLDVNGDPLAIQSANWQAAGNSEDGTYWHCVRDNVTGLVWEVKTRDSGLQDSDWTYSWYNPDTASNGGDQGLGSSDECSAGVSCDTASYVQAVNATQLCGYSDWRLPDTEALLSIVSKDRTSPAADTAFFPNMQGAYYWSSVSVSGDSDNAWLVNFFMGYEYTLSKTHRDRIRLVRFAD